MQLYAAMRSVIGFDPKEKKKKTEYNTYNSIDKPTVRGEKKINNHILYSTHCSVHTLCIYNIIMYQTLSKVEILYTWRTHTVYTRVSHIHNIILY